MEDHEKPGIHAHMELSFKVLDYIRDEQGRREEAAPEAHPFGTDQWYRIELAKVTNLLLVDLLREVHALRAAMEER